MKFPAPTKVYAPTDKVDKDKTIGTRPVYKAAGYGKQVQVGEKKIYAPIVGDDGEPEVKVVPVGYRIQMSAPLVEGEVYVEKNGEYTLTPCEGRSYFYNGRSISERTGHRQLTDRANQPRYWKGLPVCCESQRVSHKDATGDYYAALYVAFLTAQMEDDQ